jgi:hypothetical protein
VAVVDPNVDLGGAGYVFETTVVWIDVVYEVFVMHVVLLPLVPLDLTVTIVVQGKVFVVTVV